ncbi:MAG: glycosyltransferase family 39 protein [Tannerella sp.]|jgi:hypothetical protein|nr:glycosyltransferase family 39 protein [Tannerella sp.]
MKNKLLSDKWIAFYYYTVMFIGAVIVLSSSRIAPFANKYVEADTSIFINIAQQMLNGKILFKELFDHKGPVLFLFNVIGLLMGGGNLTGIWFLELVLLMVTLVFIFKSMNLYVDRTIALVSTLTCLILFSTFLEGGRGDITEEFVLPFISSSMYYFLRFLKTYSINKLHFAIIAFGCAGTFLVKPNMIVVWMVGYLFVLIILLKQLEYKKILSIALISIAAFLATCAPFVIYFIYTDSWNDFIFCFWQFNVAYSDFSLFEFTVRVIKRLWFEPVGRTPFQIFLFIFFLGSLLNYKHLKYKMETWFFVISIFLTVLLISISGYIFAHYYLLFVPIFAFPFAMVYDYIKQHFTGNKKLVYAFFFVLILVGFINDTRNAFEIQPYTRNNSKEALISFVKDNTKETDKITVVGIDCWVYVLSGRESVSKYIFQFPPVYVKQYGQKIAEEYMQDVKNGKPRIIVIRVPEGGLDYLPGFQEMLDAEYEPVYLNDDLISWNIHCWIRK